MKSIDKIREEVENAAAETNNLLSCRQAAIGHVQIIEEFSKGLVDEIKNKKLLDLTFEENLQDLWKIETAFAGLNEFLLKSSGILRETAKAARRPKTKAAAHAEPKTVSAWFEETLDRLTTIRDKWLANTEKSAPRFVPSDMIEPTTKCLDELEKSITAIKSRGYLHQQKISINEDSQRYLEQFRTTLSELSLKVR